MYGATPCDGNPASVWLPAPRSVGMRHNNETDPDDAAEVPAVLAAVTVKGYRVPLISPLISQFSGPVVQMHWAPSGEAVTAYEVTGASLVAGCSHDTVAEPSPATAVTPVGTVGARNTTMVGSESGSTTLLRLLLANAELPMLCEPSPSPSDSYGHRIR